MTTPLTYVKPPYYHYCLMFSCVSTIYKLVLLMREFKVQVSHSLIIKFCRIRTNSTFWWLLFAKLWLNYGCIKLGKYLMLLKLIHLIVHIKYYKYKKMWRAKTWAFVLGLKPRLLTRTCPRRRKYWERPHNMWLYREMLKDTNPRGSYFLNLTNVSQVNFALT